VANCTVTLTVISRLTAFLRSEIDMIKRTKTALDLIFEYEQENDLMMLKAAIELLQEEIFEIEMKFIFPKPIPRYTFVKKGGGKALG